MNVAFQIHGLSIILGIPKRVYQEDCSCKRSSVGTRGRRRDILDNWHKRPIHILKGQNDLLRCGGGPTCQHQNKPCSIKHDFKMSICCLSNFTFCICDLIHWYNVTKMNLSVRQVLVTYIRLESYSLVAMFIWGPFCWLQKISIFLTTSNCKRHYFLTDNLILN